MRFCNLRQAFLTRLFMRETYPFETRPREPGKPLFARAVKNEEKENWLPSCSNYSRRCRAELWRRDSTVFNAEAVNLNIQFRGDLVAAALVSINVLFFS